MSEHEPNLPSNPSQPHHEPLETPSGAPIEPHSEVDIVNLTGDGAEHAPFLDSDFATPTLPIETSVTADSGVDYQQALRDFEELSLADVLSQAVRAPRATTRAFWLAIQPTGVANEQTSITVKSVLNRPTETITTDETEEAEKPNFILRLLKTQERVIFAQLFAYCLAVAFAIWGCTILVYNAPERIEAIDLVSGFPWLVLAVVLWMIGEFISHVDDLVVWVQGLELADMLTIALRVFPFLVALNGLRIIFDASDDPLIAENDKIAVLFKVGQGFQYILLAVTIWLIFLVGGWLLRNVATLYPQLMPVWLIDPRKQKTEKADTFESDAVVIPWYMRIHPVRVIFFLGGVVLSAVTWFATTGNNFQEFFWLIWLASVLCWVMAFAPQAWWNPIPAVIHWWQNLVRFRWTQHGWVVLVMLVIMLLGAKFRLDNLTGNPADGTSIPQEMTSDHVEKLLDALRVKQGSRNIFFANNGGREPFQMYAMALFSELPGQGINHNSLKLLAVLESLLTLPVMFWLGYELFGRENRRLGILVGLLLMAFVATSYWHVSVTRLALRIVLTPLVAGLLLIYLTRGLRDNQVGDYIKVGLVLGFGLYTYQAVRMLPVVILAGAGLALIWGYQTWRDRLTVVTNMVVLVIVAFAAFVPLYHYSVENPDQFWRRTAGRILGDDVVEETLPDGRVVQRIASIQERLDAFNQNIPVLLNNLRNAVLMFNWKGDVAWINGVPNYPVLDRYSGALFILGVVAIGFYYVRKRDVAMLLMVATLAIMLLPSALSIAFPIENPSLTRTSGALPVTYLLVAFPLAWIAEKMLSWGRTRLSSRLIVGGMCGAMVLGSYSLNDYLYMNAFARSYAVSSLPYSDAGRILRGFAESDGSYGNAFMIAYPYWWDHRAIGLASGLEGIWPNGIFDTNGSDSYIQSVDYVPKFMLDAYNAIGKFHLDPTRDLLFFYSPEDETTATQLKKWFPDGRETLYQSYQTGDNFVFFRVPALGDEGFQNFIFANPNPR